MLGPMANSICRASATTVGTLPVTRSSSSRTVSYAGPWCGSRRLHYTDCNLLARRVTSKQQHRCVFDWQDHGLIRSALLKNAAEEYFSDQDIFAQWLGCCF